jgi:hypothetical protein
MQSDPDDSGGEGGARGCHVGAISCFEFLMVFVWAGAAAAIVAAFVLR